VATVEPLSVSLAVLAASRDRQSSKGGRGRRPKGGLRRRRVLGEATVVVEVAHRGLVGDDEVGDETAVAAPPQAFAAHVVGVGTERFYPPPRVRGVSRQAAATS